MTNVVAGALERLRRGVMGRGGGEDYGGEERGRRRGNEGQC